MKLILAFLSTTLIACTSHTISHNNSNTVSLKLDTLTNPTILNVDTAYIPLTITVENKDTITIKRKYYDPTNYKFYHELIFLNRNHLYTDKDNEFVYESKYNRVIRDKGNLLLFLESLGGPNFNRISAYSISSDTVIFISDCVYNDSTQRNDPDPFTDIDKDGFLEYGGFDLNEVHPNKDSMYYIPSDYYEIRNGYVLHDSSLTKAMDIKENGIYIANPIDKNGSCCVVIKKPKHSKK